MAADVFGDSSLFEEFDKERESSGSFIFYEKGDDGADDKSRIVFQFSDSSSSEDDSDDDAEGKAKVKEQSVGYTVGKLAKETAKYGGVEPVVNLNGNDDSDNWDDSDNADNGPVVSKDRTDKATTYKLNYERNKFKSYCNIIDSTRHIPDEESAAVQVIFQNNVFSRTTCGMEAVYRTHRNHHWWKKTEEQASSNRQSDSFWKYKHHIESFIKQLLDQEERQPREVMQKIDLKASVPSCTELNDKIPVVKRTEAMRQAHAIIGCSQFYGNFLMDSLGWPLVEYNPALTESWDIPVYEQAFEDTLPVDIELMKSKAKKAEVRVKQGCWNCGGDHMIAECKQPRNQQKINESRNAMMAAKADQPKREQLSKTRYHADSSVDPKYTQYKPGKISVDLQAALGIEQNHLPMHIYKMRSLGYPPGWMAQAQGSVDPGITLFDKDGNEVGESENLQPDVPQLDVTKIVEYPGFTVEAPDMIDNADYFGLPPLQPHQLKTTLMAHSQMQTEKRKLEEEEEIAIKRQRQNESSASSQDMELDENEADSNLDPPLPMETPPCKPPLPDNTPPPTPVEANLRRSLTRELSEARSEGRSDSPSLEELEAQYQLIQKNLARAETDGDVVVLDSCDNDSQTGGDTTDDSRLGDVSGRPIDIPDDSLNQSTIEITDDSMDELDKFIPAKLTRTGSCTSIKTFGELGTGSPSMSAPCTPLALQSDTKPLSKGSGSISKDYGTPILRRTASIELLPADLNFAQGIEDHIPFENLPESTGTFNKMRGLIDKIRKKIPSRKKKS